MVTKTLTLCDRCGKPCEKEARIKQQILITKKELDFCNSCRKEFEEWIKNV